MLPMLLVDLVDLVLLVVTLAEFCPGFGVLPGVRELLFWGVFEVVSAASVDCAVTFAPALFMIFTERFSLLLNSASSVTVSLIFPAFR